MEVTGHPPENGRQSPIQERSPIGDLNEVLLDADSAAETEPELALTGGGAVAVSGVIASPPDSDADSKQTPPLFAEEEEEGVNGGDGDSQETAQIVAEEDHVGFAGDDGILVAGIESAPPVVAAGDGHTDGGFLIDLNAEDGGEDDSEDGGEENGEPDRKRMRYGSDDGGPSEQQGSYNLRLFGFDISSNNQEDEEEEDGGIQDGGGGSGFNGGVQGGDSPSVQASDLGLRQEEEEGSEEDDASTRGGGRGGGEPSNGVPKSGLRLFGLDI